MKKEELIEDWKGLRLELSAVETLLIRRFNVDPSTIEVAPARPTGGPILSERGTRAQNPTNGAHAESEDTDLPYTDLAREWVKTRSGIVTIKTFRGWLQAKYPAKAINKSSLSSPMRKLVEAGHLKVQQPGIGRRPAKYLVLQESLRL